MTKPNDIFKSCFSPGYLVAYLLLIVAQFASYPLHEYLHVLFFVVLGSLCIYNYRRCGRYHCKITGPGFVLLGLLTLLNTGDIVAFTWYWIWVIFGAITIVAFGLEFYHKGSSR